MRGDQFFEPSGPRGSMTGWAFRQLLLWAGAALAAYFVVVRLAPLMLQDGTVKPPAASAPAEASDPASPGANSMILHAGRDGHVVVAAAVNGAPVRFLVDSGATMVTLTKADAATAGVGGGLSYSLTFQTANGQVRAAPVTLRDVRIGQLAIDEVRAVVVENLGISLLGQSFLNRLDSYQMRDGILTLSWR